MIASFLRVTQQGYRARHHAIKGRILLLAITARVALVNLLTVSSVVQPSRSLHG